MTEKAYKTMGLSGSTSLVIGILMTIAGITWGTLMIVSGARLLKAKKGLTF